MARIIFTSTAKDTGKVTQKEITRDSDGVLILDEEKYFLTARKNIFKKEIERGTILSDSLTKIEWESLTSVLTLEIK